MNKKKQNNVLIILLIATILFLIPSYFLRLNYNFSMVFYEKFGTYLGDFWNFFANYLSKGLKFLPEYPVGIRFFYEFLHFDKIRTMSDFFTVNSLIIIISAFFITYVLYLIVRKTHKIFSSIWYYWILAPSFIFYSLYNYDLPAVLMTVLSYYFFTKNKGNLSSFFLALGTVFKFFPVYLLPLFIINSPKGKRFKYFLIFVVTLLAINLPYIINDYSGWIFPYMWQITQNISYSMKQQTYWWILYPYFGKYLGALSIVVFAGLYSFFAYKMKNRPLVSQIVAVLILFLLTDKIYSPQYHLYLLPFLVILPFQVNKLAFYLLEILNVIVVFFYFKLTTDYLVLLQVIVSLRYFLLIFLFIQNYKKSAKYPEIQTAKLKS